MRRILCVLLASAALTAGFDGLHAAVRLRGLKDLNRFPDAVAPDAIRAACADTSEELHALFRARGLRLEPGLIQTVAGELCHIFYEPTVPGFRASPDDDPIEELHVSVDPLSFVVRRKPIGDSLDQAKMVLGRLPRPAKVRLTVSGGFSASELDAAREFHFAGSSHEILVRPLGGDAAHPWAQDHFKSGSSPSGARVLVPRRLFEGRRQDGPLFQPMLDQMDGAGYVRSKLSWEGGDLQFVRRPSDPSKLILFFGRAAIDYWGGALTREEFAWVLRTEFGADESFDLSGFGPHADFLVAFLPRAGTVLLAEPVGADPDLVRAAALALRDVFGKRAPPTLRRLAAFLADWDGAEFDDPNRVLTVLELLERELPSLEPAIDPSLAAALDEYEREHCPSDPDGCFLNEGKIRMQAVDPELLRSASDASANYALEQAITPKLIELIRSHLPGASAWRADDFAATAERLEELGFRVIRVPYLTTPTRKDGWAGVSYVNSLLVEQRLFVPLLGLGEYEERVLAQLRLRLTRDYEVIGVPARSGLVHNGGVHCVFGIVRRVGSSAGS